MQRLRQLGWRVIFEEEVVDDFGPFHLKTIPLLALFFRLQWAWTKFVAQKVDSMLSVVLTGVPLVLDYGSSLTLIKGSFGDILLGLV